MDVVYCIDDKLALPTAVSILTLLKHNPAARVHILTDPKPKSAELFCAIGASCGAQISVIDAAPEKARGFHGNNDYGGQSTAAYRRLYIPHLLPQLDRTLYLDADTIVFKDLAALWQADLGDAPLAAVQDPWMISLPKMRAAFPYGYFNAGVFLADLERWRAEGLTERAVAEIKQSSASVTEVNGVEIALGVAEQTPLNIATQSRWKKLPAAYNCTALTMPRFATMSGEDPATTAACIADPAIVHFLAGHKPWLTQYRGLSTWHNAFNKTRDLLERRYDLSGLTWPGPFINDTKSAGRRMMFALMLVQKAKAAGLTEASVVMTGLLAEEVCRAAATNRLKITRLVCDYPTYQGHSLCGLPIQSIDQALAEGAREFILADYRRPDLFLDILHAQAAAQGATIQVIDLQREPAL